MLFVVVLIFFHFGKKKKKTLIHPQANPEKCQEFIEQLEAYETNKRPIIYLDESGFKAHDHRVYVYRKYHF